VFTYGLGAAVAIGWLASVVADIGMDGYTTPVALHGLMGVVLGSVFGDAGLRRARGRLVAERRAADADPRDD
jgi:uncharacterized membrane protein